MLLKLAWATEVISALFIIILVLLHSPKGDGIAGIGGASQLFSSQKSAEKGLNKLTMIFAVIFAVTAFLLGFNIIK